MDAKLLGIYLNDHLAGSRAGLELARRAERENRGNAVGDSLATLLAELEQERAVLEQVMRMLGVAPDPLKQGAAWLLERVGRLKLNGRLLRYSPLSRLVELEGLLLGIQGRECLWRTLERLARTERRLAGIDFEALIQQAQAQHQVLERLRLQAADAAFSKAQLPRHMPAPARGTVG